MFNETVFVSETYRGTARRALTASGHFFFAELELDGAGRRVMRVNEHVITKIVQLIH